MFELIYEELSKIDQIELDVVARNQTFLRFLRTERTEIEKFILELSVTPDDPNDFMVKHAIMQSRKGCVDDLIRFLEERRDDIIDLRGEATANDGD